ncbi:MAG: dUTP diphosphatase [Saprospiraceae bacterium]|jgi:dUTP pyrophosphatase|uniref:dUTP diphosphatase n=1 Tax=Candidatus Brachybacter algidus TaxID=2982024 RepID=UPI001B5F441C|nr:dUTP diphosphatase [Candidatus Brachybacter algidus]MBP7307406.1 dUTP diphosphatase [Saprospiraceae bacterium]MBK6373454.1 dUTP diphosphatase [Candidatus Brachybacter algidus]MBK6449518.1 dUTP diphosphatase [Candidatus Brachybacter algidus]MBK7604592.1 dUTP diphosphatase [Candidatus Brachybacter algidus]MBK8355232.1 dUTP diphosphatase [Candidatus Brachybacter algidus]
MQVKIINKSRNPLPNYETAGSAGMDLRANIDIPIELQPMERMLIPTGLYIELQPGTEAQVRPRSGLSIKKGLTVINAPGTIDSDYRGELKIPIINLSQELQTIDPAERIAQMVIARYETVTLVEVDDISPSDRGDRGFGSTGHQ